MKKAIGQTVRELKREVNKKVLKVPGIEQKVLDATNNEAWGPHGSLLADIAQASRNYHEYQMIMAVIWKRISDTGKNWRHVYKALTVLEYLVANGSERVIEEIREHAYQISTLSNFQYIDSSGRDQGNNVRRKSQSLVLLVNDKERITEVRQKAAANRDKFRNNTTGGMYRPGSYSSSGSHGDRYEDDRYGYGSREEDRSGYGYGRDYEERYSRGDYRDGDDDEQYGSRSRISDRDHDHGHHSSRGNSTKVEDHSLEGRLERKLSEQDVGALPSYEESVSQSPLHYERDGGISASSAPKGSSPVNDNPHQTSAATGSSIVSDNPTEATAASGNCEVGAFDEFDPRGRPVSGTPGPANNAEMDLFGSLSESFSSNALALVSASETTTSQGNANLHSTVSFATPTSASNNFNPVLEDPFGDSPFKASPSTETAPSQPQTHQSLAPSQSSCPNTESVSNFGFGVSFSAPGASDAQHLSLTSQFLSMPPPSQETGILADILSPAPLPETISQQNFSVRRDAQSSSSFSASPGQMAPESFFAQSGQLMQQDFSTVNSREPAAQAFSAPGGQLLQPPSSVPTSQHAQQPFPSHADPYAQSGSHMNGGFLSMTAGSMALIPLHKASTGQSANYLSSQSPIDHASQFNSGNLLGQPLGQGVRASQNVVSKPPKDKFETKSTVWADTLSRGLVDLNISGPKINPLADIGVDFDAINRREKRMEKTTKTTVTSTVTMGKAMGSGSGMGRAGLGALRPPSNPMMGMGQMQQPPTGNYNSMMGRGGYPQQHPYGGGGGGGYT